MSEASPSQVWTPKGAPARFGPENVLRGLRAARTGEVISLNLRLDDPHVPFGRGPFQRHVRLHNQVRPVTADTYVVINDDEVTIALQGSSQWDSYAHFGMVRPDEPGLYYGGAGLGDTYPQNHSLTLGIDALGPGLAARGVLLDLVATEGGGRDFLDGGQRLDRAALERCLAAQETTVEAGDIVLVYTGFERRRASLDGEYPADSAGLDASTVDLLLEMDLLALAADNPGVEATPSDFAVHIGLLRGRGVPLGELWALDELALACRSDRRYDFLLASVPLNVPGAFGSTANAIAVR
jgi:kynurenine formamidase